MTDILIKGMEIPKDEYVDVRIFKDGRVIANQADANEPNSHYATFTAIAVPPHGRLIDADKLTSAILSCMVAKKAYSKKDFGLVKMVIYHIVKAPTVLEANKWQDGLFYPLEDNND